MNTSATGGYIQPATPAVYGDELDNIFQAALASWSGLDGQYVRPRWQQTAPKTPAIDIDWCAVGVQMITPDDGPVIEHLDGSDRYVRHETIEVLASFYGPQSMNHAAAVRDNVAIPQNMDALEAQEIGFVETDDIVPRPELINQQWLKRYDMTLTFRRRVVLSYPILNIESAEFSIHPDPDIGTTTAEVTP